jgi:hypothetical protein
MPIKRRCQSRGWSTRRRHPASGSTSDLRLRLSPSNGTIPCLSLHIRRLFIELATPHLALQPGTIHDLPKPTHCLLNGFPLTQRDLNRHNSSPGTSYYTENSHPTIPSWEVGVDSCFVYIPWFLWGGIEFRLPGRMASRASWGAVSPSLAGTRPVCLLSARRSSRIVASPSCTTSRRP